MKYVAAKRFAQLRHVVRVAEEMLGEPGQLVLLDYDFSAAMLSDAVLEERRGLGGLDLMRRFDDGHRGHGSACGLERYRLALPQRNAAAVLVHDGFEILYPASYEQMWVLPRAHVLPLYRHVRRLLRNRAQQRDVPPVMDEAERVRLFDNTVGFLTGDSLLYKRFGVPRKRGVLLAGEPGNGKTMACRWLLAACRRRGLSWRSVSTEEFDRARAEGCTSSLFHLDKPGLVLFDDFDLGMRNRDHEGHSREHSALLAGLDGLEQHEGVVYLFTTNARLQELDSAFLRRGRIDQIFQFARPTAALREQMIRQHWPAEIVAALNVEEVVAASEGRSFAELAELKKLLVPRYIDTHTWDWPWAWQAFSQGQVSAAARRIGFAPHLDAWTADKNTPTVCAQARDE